MSLQTLANQLETIAANHGGQLTPKSVLDAARPKSHPLHSRFEWDDKRAGEGFRMIQAAALIRSVRVTVEPPSGEAKDVSIRRFVSIRENSNEPGFYMPVTKALESSEMRDILLEEFRRDARAFAKRYANLEEAKGIIDAMGGIAD